MVVASGVLAFMVGGAFAIVLLFITELRATTDLRRQTREFLVAADTLEKHVIDLETGLRGFVITRDESFLEPSNAARAALPGSARALKRGASDVPVEHARVTRIVRALEAYLRQYALPLVDAVRRGDASARSVENTVAAKQRIDALRAGLHSLREAERVRLGARDADLDRAAGRATAAAAVGIVGSILLVLVFVGYLTRVIVRPLRRAATMANRIAGGDLSARMPETDIAEIGALERSFNVMAASLEESRDELASLLAEQAALRRVATLVARGARPAEAFAETAAEVRRLLGTDAAALCRYEPDETVIVLALEADVELGIGVGDRLTLEGESAMGAVFRSGRAARLDSYEGTAGTLSDVARKGHLGASVGAPIVVDGRLWGVVVVASRGDALPPDTEQRLGDFTELVATAIANADGRDQLNASRERLVTAADDARGLVVRDLHDGAQQRLVHTIVTLKLLQNALSREDGDVEPLAGEALRNAEAANAELRELAQGILPVALTRGGLRAAISTVVTRINLPVEVDLPAARFPSQIEASAYFIVAEALTNAVKHANASRAAVRAWVEDGALHVDVCDDGIGGARRDGSGLLGLDDRVAALGGRLEIESPPGGGTQIAATLPL
jgi:signal transduction histidine kinase